jgi:hypothetical protein
MFGGSALNPINALTRILGDLQDADGRIQLPGFYDRSNRSPTRSARNGTRWVRRGRVPRRHRPVQAGRRARLFGAGAAVGAADRDINGIWGGYTGPAARR